MPRPDLATAFHKITRYCAFQERSPEEVYKKLEKLQVDQCDIPEIIEQLKAENYLDEKRYALFYAGGKFRMKRWGKIKIAIHLRQQGIDDDLINEAIDETIPDNEYQKMVKKEATKKYESLKNELPKLDKKAKTIRFLQSRGYENELVFSVCNDLFSDN